MSNDAAQTLVPSSATLWLAPEGTTAPINLSIAMGTVDAAWKDVGLIAEDGLSFGEAKETFDVPAFGVPAPVREGIRRKVSTLTIQLLQHNTLNFQTVYGGGSVTITTGVAKYTPPTDKLLTPVAAVLEYADGTKKHRLVIPSCTAREGVQRVFPNDGAVVMPLALTVLGGVSGVATWYGAHGRRHRVHGGLMDLDLDAARASRLSATGESINVHLRGQVYCWPSEMPVAYLLDNPRDDDTFEIHLARVCLGEAGLKQLAESGASSQDLIAMVGAVLEQWGVPQGESPASDGGSPSEAGQPSSETASAEDSPTPVTSGDPEPAASAD